MATGFKQATVNASDVPSTQTDFPAYVDLSRLGITTTAEANSVRCYSDSSKTTELAREIVSTSEMHVLIPSLTSTFTLYVDWDGSRSDYAASATYGRNAVWDDYEIVSHDGGSTDSTGNNTMSLNGGATAGGLTGQVGDATLFDGMNDYLDTNFDLNSTNFTIQGWFMPKDTDNSQFLGARDSAGQNGTFLFQPDEPIFRIRSGGSNYSANGSAQTVDAWYMLHARLDSTNGMEIFTDGGSDDTNARTTGSSNTDDHYWGAWNDVGGIDYANIGVDEVRYRYSALSDDWIETEYNNQSDESTFWGTWTDVGGGPTYRFQPFLGFAGL